MRYCINYFVALHSLREILKLAIHKHGVWHLHQSGFDTCLHSLKIELLYSISRLRHVEKRICLLLAVQNDLGERISNIVLMGMGEPLDNYDNVKRAIDVLTADWGFGWSPKRITLSSIGVLPTLKRYLDETRCHLAISMHDAFPDERGELMPVQKSYPLKDVVNLIRQYDFTGQRRVSFEYTMFSGHNDDKRHADAIIRLLSGLECRVNLIRFHKIPDFPYVSSSEGVMEVFRDRLNKAGITSTIRASRGEDIFAACGMLAGKHKQQ